MDPTIEFTGSSLQIYSQIDEYMRKNGLTSVTVQVVAFDSEPAVDLKRLFISSLNPDLRIGETPRIEDRAVGFSKSKIERGEEYRNFTYHYKCDDGCGREVEGPGVRCTSCVILDEKIW